MTRYVRTKYVIEIEIEDKEELTQDQIDNLPIFSNNHGKRGFIEDHLHDLSKNSDVFPYIITVGQMYEIHDSRDERIIRTILERLSS